MEIPRAPHSWNLSPRQAIAVQQRLRGRVRLQPAPVPRYLVGLDCAFLDHQIIGVAVLWDVEQGRVVETRGARDRLRFPYVPGLLSFRELPVLLRVLRRLQTFGNRGSGKRRSITPLEVLRKMKGNLAAIG